MIARSLGLPAYVQHIQRTSGGGLGYGVDASSHAYSNVAAVHACVKAVGDALTALPLMISTEDDQILESGPAVELAECPAPGVTQRAFVRETSAYLDLYGCAPWRKTFDGAGRVMRVDILHPMRVTPKRSQATGELMHWLYLPPGRKPGQEVTIPPDEMHMILDRDYEQSHDPLRCLSPKQVVRSTIRQLWKAGIANESNLDNDAKPGLIFDFGQHAAPTEDQIREIHSHMADRYQGVQNRNRTIVTHGGATVKTVEANFKDMEFTELIKLNRTDVCMVFNVPPPVAGIFEDSNYAHAQAAEERFYVGRIVPTAARIAEEWQLGVLKHFESDQSLAAASARRDTLSVTQRCCPTLTRARRAARRNGSKLYAWFDASSVPVIQQAALARASNAREWWTMGVPLNSILDATDAPFEHVQGGDTGFIPVGVVPINEAAMPGATDPDGSDETGLLTGPENGTGRDGVRGVSVIDKASEAALAKLWERYRASWSGLERATLSKVSGHFHSLKREMLDNVRRLWPEDGAKSFTAMQRRDLIGSVLFDLAKADDRLTAKVGPLLREAVALGGEQAVSEHNEATGDEKKFSETPSVTDAIRRRQAKVKGVNKTLQRRLSAKIADALEDGQSKSQIQDAIRAEFKFAGSRAKTIAQTEIGNAVNESRQEGIKQAGVPLKSWLWSRKEKGRPNHAATEADTMRDPIPVDEPFRISGSSATCQHPGGTGKAEEDINCGCTSVSRYPGDSLKAVLSREFLTYEQLKARKDATTAKAKDGKHGTDTTD